MGTSLVYPTLLAAVSDAAHPAWRPRRGIYRFWRDSGYAIGALVGGLVATALGLSAAVIAGGAITLASGLLAARWISATRSRP